MYIMGLGGKPVGECYFSPPDKDGTAWLIGQYYSGSNVKLLMFREPTTSPEEGSPEKRLRDLEDDVYYLKKYAESYIRSLCNLTGDEYKSFNEFKASAGSPPEHVDVSTEAQYLICSQDLYSAQRGW